MQRSLSESRSAESREVDPLRGRLHEYVCELRQEFPRLRFVDKTQDQFSRWVDLALRVITLGAQRRYLTAYVTTIGQALYVPRGWESRSAEEQYITLRHEAVHLRQFRRHGLVWMSLLYLLGGLPLGGAWARARLEWEAYRETLAATYEVRGRQWAYGRELQEHVVRQFVGGAYGWMWPFPWVVRRWVRQTLAALDAQHGAAPSKDETQLS